jgi:3-methyladenine DNA glycosylase AlkC
LPLGLFAEKPAMKNLFDANSYSAIATDLARIDSHFDATRFLSICLDGLDQRELMDRLRQTAIAFNATLPGSYRDKVNVLRLHAARICHGFIGIWPCEFVGRFGLDDVPASLDALAFFTGFGSAEFAIRPFLVRDLTGTLAVMRTWAVSDNEHVRRLASEGSRPRLPWGTRLTALVANPSPSFDILNALRADDSLYVRKSVANHLNDICKDHPDTVLDLVATWDRADTRTAWIVKHALRTLIKRGHPRALTLLGAGKPARVNVTFAASPQRLALGGKLALEAVITSPASKSQRLLVDYVVHYARASGKAAEKVFKWTTLDLSPRAAHTLIKRQVIRDFSTRKHHAGIHRVELQINGRRLAESSFRLSVSQSA